MKNILLLGVGKTAPYLIKYLLKERKKCGWKLRVADRVPTLVDKFTKELLRS